MARKLAISNTVQPAVTVVLADAGVAGGTKTFKFTLTCDRLDGQKLRDAMGDNSQSATAFMKEVVKGWEGQRLVLEDDGSPSPFSAEALDDLLAIAGVPALCFQSYLKEVTAKEKN